MKVVHLRKFAARDTEAVGRHIAENAEEIEGVAVTIKMRDGTHRTAFTGCYKARPEEAAGVAMRLSIKLAKAADSS